MSPPSSASRASDEVTELTIGQQLIWIRQQLTPSVALYDEPVTFVIHGDLDEDAFVRGFAQLVQTNDAMRFVMGEVEDEPVARVLAEGANDCELVDLTSEPDGLEDWIAERMIHPLYPSKCLYDAALVKLANDQYCWFLSTHT